MYNFKEPKASRSGSVARILEKENEKTAMNKGRIKGKMESSL